MQRDNWLTRCFTVIEWRERAAIRVSKPFTFVGREEVMEIIEREIFNRRQLTPPHCAPHEICPIHLLAGASGVGKTRVLAELEGQLNIPVLFAGFGNDTPYDKLRDYPLDTATAHRLLHSVGELPVMRNSFGVDRFRTAFPRLTIAEAITLWADNHKQKAEEVGCVIIAIDELQKLPQGAVRIFASF